MRQLARAMLVLTAAVTAGCASDTPSVLAPQQHPQLTKSAVFDFPGAIAIDRVAETVTLPLLHGTFKRRDVWYVVTESSNNADAGRRGVNWAPRLANALGTKAVQPVSLDGRNELVFSGTVDFSPQRVVVPSSPNGFPPSSFEPGAVGDANYSPYVTLGDGIVLNATQVANASGVQDGVVRIDYTARTVTLDLFEGFYDGNPVLYLHQDASSKLVAAVEGSNYAPNMDAAPGEGSFDQKTSARAAIIPIVNGPRGVANPERQGLESFLLGEGDPKNITQVFPDERSYVPVWDVHPAVWTQAAIDAGLRRQVRGDADLTALVQQGLIVSGGDGIANTSLGGLRSSHQISNCPIIARL